MAASGDKLMDPVFAWLLMTAAIIATVAVIGKLSTGNWAGVPQEDEE